MKVHYNRKQDSVTIDHNVEPRSKLSRGISTVKQKARAGIQTISSHCTKLSDNYRSISNSAKITGLVGAVALCLSMIQPAYAPAFFAAFTVVSSHEANQNKKKGNLWLLAESGTIASIVNTILHRKGKGYLVQQTILTAHALFQHSEKKRNELTLEKKINALEEMEKKMEKLQGEVQVLRGKNENAVSISSDKNNSEPNIHELKAEIVNLNTRLEELIKNTTEKKNTQKH